MYTNGLCSVCSVWDRHGKNVLSEFMITHLVAIVFNVKTKSKGKVFPVHAKKAYKGS